MNTRTPLIRSALCLALGIILYDGMSSFWMHRLWLIPVVGVFSFLPLFWKKGRKELVLLGAVLFLVACGMGRMALSDEAWSRQSSWAVGSTGLWTGIVRESPSVNREGEPYARYPVELETIRYEDGDEKNIAGTAYIYETNPKQLYRPGDRISVSGKMTAVRIYKNPGKIDLEGRYRSQRLLGRIYPEKGETLRFSGDSGEFRIQRWAEDTRNRISHAFAPYMDPVRLHILGTLLFGGNYNDIPAQIMNSFSATGIVHILSVSGSHVALLFGFLYFLGKWIHLPERVVISLAILLVLFYSFLSGLVPPVIRAAAMGILSVGGVFLDREKSSLNLLGAAVTGMLLWDPFYLYDVSFQLSVGASAGILIFYRPLSRFFSRFSHLPHWIGEGIALSTAAQVLTIPLVLYDFHSFPFYFIPANLFVTPVLEWVIIAGLLAAVVSFIFLPLAGGILQLADYLLWFSIRLNLTLSSRPGASLRTGAMTVMEILLYYSTVGILYFKKYLFQRPRRLMAAGGCWCLLALGCFTLFLLAPKARLYAPELGPDQGAVLLSGGHRILYYRGGSIPSHTSNWEWNSFLGYVGLTEADLLLLNLEEVKEPIPLSLSIPVREIWVAGGPVEKKAPQVLKDFKGTLRNVKAARLTMGNMAAITNGSSFLLTERDRAVYFSGRKGLSLSSFPEHTLWVAGNRKNSAGIPVEEIRRVRGEAIIYGGSRLASSWEDMDLIESEHYPAANVYEKGMQAASFRKDWTLEGHGLWYRER